MRTDHKLAALALVSALLVAAVPRLFGQQSVGGGAGAELVAGMVSLDQAYIPVLALSNQAGPSAARKAMAMLDTAVNSPARKLLASRSASRRSVFTRSPAHSTFSAAVARARSEFHRGGSEAWRRGSL